MGLFSKENLARIRNGERPIIYDLKDGEHVIVGWISEEETLQQDIKHLKEDVKELEEKIESKEWKLRCIEAENNNKNASKDVNGHLT